MTVIPTPLADCLVIVPRVFNDDRGYFFESFNEKTFAEITGMHIRFIQDNQSYSTKGVLRGLHFQKGEFAQSKLVRVTKGEVLDVAVDLRKGSPTYGQHHAVTLSAENFHQLFIPKGFAHGFIVLSDDAIFQYKCDGFYNKQSEGGVYYADPALGIDWGLDKSLYIVNEKDEQLPLLKDIGETGF